MQLVEQHCIRKSDSRYALIDEAAFKSKISIMLHCMRCAKPSSTIVLTSTTMHWTS